MRWLLAPAIVALALAPSPIVDSTPAGAQNGGRLDLVAQTLFVGDEAAEISLRVTGAPNTAFLRFAVYDDPATTRTEARADHQSPPRSGTQIAFFECTLEGDCRDQAALEVGSGGILTVTLKDEEIGESLRRDPGALPFVVDLLDADGTRLDQIATSLVVLDDDPAPSVQVAFLTRLLAPVSQQVDLGAAIDPAALRRAANGLAARPDLPVTTEIRPETLQTLADLHPDRLAELLEIIDGRPLIAGPWVDMDEEAWRLAGEERRVIAQYARGSETVETLAGDPPTGIVLLDRDAEPATLGLLQRVGATGVIVDDAQLTARTRNQPPNQPFQLLDENDVAMPALRFDEDLLETLAEEDVELGAYRALTELALLAQAADADTGVLLDLERIDPSTLDLLLTGIEGRQALGVADVRALFDLELARIDGDLLRGDLVSTTPPDVSALAADLRAAETAVDTLGVMLDPELEFLEPLTAHLRASVAADLEPATARSYVARVLDEVRALTTGIEIPEGARITLTDRRTDLPLVIVNNQPLPLNVELLLSAEKIRFPDGERLALRLSPGTNQIVIPVETLASGDARVTATVISPGGLFELGTGTVDIRSTAISGLGLVISIVALVILGAWWVRTILRLRRHRAAATVSATSDEEPALDEGES